MHIVRCTLNKGSWLVYREGQTTRNELEQLIVFARKWKVPLRVLQSEEQDLALELGPMGEEQEQAFLVHFGIWCKPDGRMRSINEYPPEGP